MALAVNLLYVAAVKKHLISTNSGLHPLLFHLESATMPHIHDIAAVVESPQICPVHTRMTYGVYRTLQFCGDPQTVAASIPVNLESAPIPHIHDQCPASITFSP